ncbi:hypothetical protein [Spirosoma areae]
MAILTADYETQLTQLTDYLLASREMIVTQWRTKCLTNEDLNTNTRASFSREEFTDQVPALFAMLTQRIGGKPQEGDPVEMAGQHARHRWQRGYSLTDLFIEWNLFYEALTEGLQQFLGLYPQTLPQVITQAHTQLLRLSTHISIGSVFAIEQWRQPPAEQPAQVRQAALDSRHPPTSQQADHLRQTMHDLRSYFGIISTAASLLQLPLKPDEWATYREMLNRNVKLAEHLLNQLPEYMPVEGGQANPASTGK